MTHQNNNYNNYNNYNNNFNENYNNQFNKNDELYQSQLKTMESLNNDELKLKNNIKFGVGVIIAIAIILLILLGVLIFGKGSSNDVNNSNNENQVTPVDTEKVVGNERVGYITVPVEWQQFVSMDSNAFMYSDPTQQFIIALEFTQKTDKTLDVIANQSAKNLMNDANFKEVSINKVKVAGYDAYRVDAFSVTANKWAVNWIFADEDENIHIISFEAPNTDNDYMAIPQTFSLTSEKQNNKDTNK